MQQGTEQALDEYKEERRMVKAVMREVKREAEDRFWSKVKSGFRRE